MNLYGDSRLEIKIADYLRLVSSTKGLKVMFCIITNITFDIKHVRNILKSVFTHKTISVSKSIIKASIKNYLINKI